MTPSDLIGALRSSAPYVHAHNGRIFVVCFGGEAALRADFDSLLYDLALLHSLGVKLVLVHGVRPQIDAQLKSRGLEPKFINDLRVTDSAALDCVKAAVGGLRMEIEAKLSTSLASTPMGGARLKVASGNWITARPVGVREGVDHQHTGEVRRADAATIHEVLKEGRVVLLSPIGYSPTGEIFNLRAEDVATATATALSADKLIFITPSDPMTWTLAGGAGDAGQISLAEAKRLLTAEPSKLNAIDRIYVQAAIAGARGGVKRVHLIGQEGEGLLLRELYTRDGAGLLIYADDSYDVTRDATIDDVGGILQLIQPLEKSGVLVPRSRDQLENEIGNFMVMVRDGMVIACCALMPFNESQTGELACVAVHPAYRGSGRAALLLVRAEQAARRMGLKKLFSLTTHTPHWFIERGFVQAQLDDLPQQRQQLYNYQRNSLVLVKDL
ncbi:MAG: amino-acid N-acetyltransferase [Pseudomonadota bacterium]